MQRRVKEDKHAAFSACRRNDALIALANAGFANVRLQRVRCDREYWERRGLIIIFNGVQAQSSRLVSMGAGDETNWTVERGHIIQKNVNV